MYLCITKSLQRISKNAKVAQLVERDLAKVEVAGSNPVFRSSKKDLATGKVLFYFTGENTTTQAGQGLRAQASPDEARNCQIPKAFLLGSSLNLLRQAWFHSGCHYCR